VLLLKFALSCHKFEFLPLFECSAQSLCFVFCGDANMIVLEHIVSIFGAEARAAFVRAIAADWTTEPFVRGELINY
jgi:hypothetical protein